MGIYMIIWAECSISLMIYNMDFDKAYYTEIKSSFKIIE